MFQETASPQMGSEPEAGRFFVHEEGQTPGTHPVIVLGYNYWQKRFGGDREIVGKSLRLGGQQYTVVGIAPWTFPSPDGRRRLRIPPRLKRDRFVL